MTSETVAFGISPAGEDAGIELGADVELPWVQLAGASNNRIANAAGFMVVDLNIFKLIQWFSTTE